MTTRKTVRSVHTVMVPTKRVRWSCDVNDHWHDNSTDAQLCINRGGKKPGAGPKKWSPEKLVALLDERQSGATCAQLADKYELSQVRIHQLVRLAKYHRATRG